MILHPPFLITARLLPGLRIGDASLSLETNFAATADGRDQATFYLDFADGTSYEDSNLRSGVQGFVSTVEVFETFLSFMLACSESYAYQQRTGRDGENVNLFPPHIAEWLYENNSNIEAVWCELLDEGGQSTRTDLIEE